MLNGFIDIPVCNYARDDGFGLHPRACRRTRFFSPSK
jgi:hypothetical protein